MLISVLSFSRPQSIAMRGAIQYHNELFDIAWVLKQQYKQWNNTGYDANNNGSRISDLSESL